MLFPMISAQNFVWDSYRSSRIIVCTFVKTHRYPITFGRFWSNSGCLDKPHPVRIEVSNRRCTTNGICVDVIPRENVIPDDLGIEFCVGFVSVEPKSSQDFWQDICVDISNIAGVLTNLTR